MPLYWLRCVCELFMVGTSVALVKVQSALEVLEGDSCYINMGGQVVHSEREMNDVFKLQLNVKAREMPVIVFLTEPTSETMAVIDEVCKSARVTKFSVEGKQSALLE